jgi:hypothetical protein
MVVDPDLLLRVGWMDRESSGAATVQRCMQPRVRESYLCIYIYTTSKNNVVVVVVGSVVLARSVSLIALYSYSSQQQPAVQIHDMDVENSSAAGLTAQSERDAWISFGTALWS